MKNFFSGPLLIMAAAGLWALDPIFRSALGYTFQPATVVMVEHALGFILFAIAIAPKAREFTANLKKLSPSDWVNVFAMTIVSSILGTLLFTEAIALGAQSFDYITPTLLQKFQPIFVLSLSFIFLRETPSLRFLLLVPLALIGGYMIDFGTQSISLEFTDKEALFLLSIGAAAAWGSGTIFSKNILKKLDFKQAGAIRFALAAILTPFVAYTIKILSNVVSATGMVDWHYDYSFKFAEFSKLFDTSMLFSQVSLFGIDMSLSVFNIFIIALIGVLTGAFGIFVYYRGLRNTEARIATFAELTYPVITLLVALTVFNPYGAPQSLPLAKAFGVVILIIVMIVIGLENGQRTQDKN